MPRNVEGEFELVLGNKQLLSLFFLVVVLFAVFFSLGYMVGKSGTPATTSASQQPASAPASERPPASSGGSPAAAPPAEAPAAPPTETQPARSEPVAVSTAPAAPAKRPKEPPKQEAARPVAAASEGGAPDTGVLAAQGLHLQLAAVRVKDDAEVMVETLRKKGYAVVLHSQARDGWYRVLVGPFSNERAARDTKAQLEKDGYKSILKRP